MDQIGSEVNGEVRRGGGQTKSQRQGTSRETRQEHRRSPRVIPGKLRGRLSKYNLRHRQLSIAFAAVASLVIFSALTQLISLCRLQWRRAGVSHGVEGRSSLARVARRLADNGVGGGEYPGLEGRCQRLLGDRQRQDPAGRSVVFWTSDRGGSAEQRVHMLSIPVEDPHSPSEDTEGTARGRNRWVEGPPRYSQVIEEDVRRGDTHPLAEDAEGISGIQDQLAGGPPSYRQVMEEDRQRRETHLRTQDAEGTGGAEDPLMGAPPSYYQVTQDDWSRRWMPVFVRELLGGHGARVGDHPPYSEAMEDDAILRSAGVQLAVYPSTTQNAVYLVLPSAASRRENGGSVRNAVRNRFEGQRVSESMATRSPRGCPPFAIAFIVVFVVILTIWLTAQFETRSIPGSGGIRGNIRNASRSYSSDAGRW